MRIRLLFVTCVLALHRCVAVVGSACSSWETKTVASDEVANLDGRCFQSLEVQQGAKLTLDGAMSFAAQEILIAGDMEVSSGVVVELAGDMVVQKQGSVVAHVQNDRSSWTTLKTRADSVDTDLTFTDNGWETCPTGTVFIVNTTVNKFGEGEQTAPPGAGEFFLLDCSSGKPRLGSNPLLSFQGDDGVEYSAIGKKRRPELLLGAEVFTLDRSIHFVASEDIRPIIEVYGSFEARGVLFQSLGDPEKRKAPVTFHPGSSGKLQDSLLRDSRWRCVEVDTSNRVELTSNVAFNTTGACFTVHQGDSQVPHILDRNLVVKSEMPNMTVGWEHWGLDHATPAYVLGTTAVAVTGNHATAVGRGLQILGTAVGQATSHTDAPVTFAEWHSNVVHTTRRFYFRRKDDPYLPKQKERRDRYGPRNKWGFEESILLEPNGQCFYYGGGWNTQPFFPPDDWVPVASKERALAPSPAQRLLLGDVTGIRCRDATIRSIGNPLIVEGPVFSSASWAAINLEGESEVHNGMVLGLEYWIGTDVLPPSHGVILPPVSGTLFLDKFIFRYFFLNTDNRRFTDDKRSWLTGTFQNAIFLPNYLRQDGEGEEGAGMTIATGITVDETGLPPRTPDFERPKPAILLGTYDNYATHAYSVLLVNDDNQVLLSHGSPIWRTCEGCTHHVEKVGSAKQHFSYSCPLLHERLPTTIRILNVNKMAEQPKDGEPSCEWWKSEQWHSKKCKNGIVVPLSGVTDDLGKTEALPEVLTYAATAFEAPAKQAYWLTHTGGRLLPDLGKQDAADTPLKNLGAPAVTRIYPTRVPEWILFGTAYPSGSNIQVTLTVREEDGSVVTIPGNRTSDLTDLMRPDGYAKYFVDGENNVFISPAIPPHLRRYVAPYLPVANEIPQQWVLAAQPGVVEYEIMSNCAEPTGTCTNNTAAYPRDIPNLDLENECPDPLADALPPGGTLNTACYNDAGCIPPCEREATSWDACHDECESASDCVAFVFGYGSTPSCKTFSSCNAQHLPSYPLALFWITREDASFPYLAITIAIPLSVCILCTLIVCVVKYRAAVAAQTDPELAKLQGLRGDGWRVSTVIGRGAFGIVFKGVWEEDGSPVAVKVLPLTKDALKDLGGTNSDPVSNPLSSLRNASKEGPSEGDKPVVQVTVQQTGTTGDQSVETNQEIAEISRLKSLQHPNIVRYFGAECVSEHLCLLMEFVPGGSLASKISAEGGRLSVPMARRLTLGIASGLAYLHGHRILHRDIKGDNVLLSEDEIPKVTDFGCSKFVKELQTTVADSVTGTPRWMAPEVIKTPDNGYTYPADVWSLGCTVCEMLSGSPPWPEFETPWAAMYHIVNSEIEIDPLLDDDSKAFVMRLLQRIPEARPSAQDVTTDPWVAEG